jgi:hypothetical protein
MAIPPLSRAFDSPFDKKFREGGRPGEFNQLGINKEPIYDPKQLVSKFVSQKENPRTRDLYSDSVFPRDVAEQSQQKIDDLSFTDFASFKDQRDNDAAQRFLMAYSGPGGAIERGLVLPEEAVTKERLATLRTEPATTGSNQSSPNTAGKFPNQGVGV